MATQLKVPASPTVSRLNIAAFKGVDFANNATQVKPYRSPNAENITSDLAGKPVKRTGWRTVGNFETNRINGIYRLATEDVEKVLVHAGTTLYEWQRQNGVWSAQGTVLREGLADNRSTAFQKNKRLWILDGKQYLVYGEFDGSFTCKPVAEMAYTPTTIISRNPDGSGGTQLETVNMVSSKRTNSFLGKADVTKYVLDSQGLDSTAVTARKLTSSGDWQELAETTHFTVDRTNGTVTFKTAPGASPVTGRDNVEITFSKASEGAADKVNGCTIHAAYGVSGATDRIFLAGNPSYPNLLWWSGLDDPSYFPDLNYAILGQDSSAIMGFSRVGNSLAVHKEDNEQDQTIFLLTGAFSDGKAVFSVTGGIAGVGAVSKYCFATLGTEPFFLARQGVYAITTQDFNLERYAQVRSYYINPKLTAEKNLSDAAAIIFNNCYYLSLNGHVYMADGRQKEYEKNAPQSTFQYEWYYLTGIDARVWWELDGRLYFGDGAGHVKAFALDTEHTAQFDAYADDGAPIRCLWDTPFFTFDELSRYKTLKGFWLMLSPYRRSSVNIYYRVKGELRLTKHSTIDTFDFNDIDFTRFSFNTDDSPVIVPTNTKAKKFMLIQFRIENDAKGEGFGFYEMEAQYIVQGRFKG